MYNVPRTITIFDVANTIGNTLGNTIGNTIGNSIGNTIQQKYGFSRYPFYNHFDYFIIVFKKGLMPYRREGSYEKLLWNIGENL